MVAGFEENNIARYQVVGGDGLVFPIAQDVGFGSGEFLQSSEGGFRPTFLHDTQNGIQNDDGHDGGGIDPLTEEGGDDGSHDQQNDDEVVQLIPEHGKKT